MAVKQKALTLQQKYNALKKEHNDLVKKYESVCGREYDLVNYKQNNKIWEPIADRLKLDNDGLKKMLDESNEDLRKAKEDMATTEQTNIALEKEIQLLATDSNMLCAKLKEAEAAAQSFQTTAKMLQVENGSLRRMECANINEAHSKVMQVLYNLSEYEVPALLSEVVKELKERQAGADKFLQDQIKERNTELKGHRDVSIAMDMALNGDSDFIKIFTAQRSIRNEGKDCCSSTIDCNNVMGRRH